MARHWWPALIVAWFSSLLLSGSGLAVAQPVDIFRELTGHIERQIQRDKQDFVDAQVCTEWFYEQRRTPRQPKAVGVAFTEREGRARTVIRPADCPARYPGGLTAAREDFSTTQSALSLSLTFYEFALVGDRNDDGRYNAAELKDVLESFDLAYDRNRPDSIHLMVLTNTFDALHGAGGMERLMASMGALYDKGYRLTPSDRATLDKMTR